jgi:hypothetical protein
VFLKDHSDTQVNYSRGNKTTAMSLKDHSDTWVNATTFICILNATLTRSRGNHSTGSVASQGTAAGKACAPWREPHQAISSFWLRVLAGKASAPQRSPAQLSAVSSFGLRMPGAQSVLEGAQPYFRTSYSGERVPLARRGTCEKESLDASVHCS